MASKKKLTAFTIAFNHPSLNCIAHFILHSLSQLVIIEKWGYMYMPNEMKRMTRRVSFKRSRIMMAMSYVTKSAHK